MMPIGFRPLAAPTAREAPGRPMRAGKLGVADRRSIRNRQQSLPDLFLKRRAGHVKRQIEGLEIALEIGVELLGDAVAAPRHPGATAASGSGRAFLAAGPC